MESAKNNYSIPHPERVSLWKIEPALAPPALNPLPMLRPKRPRTDMLPSSPDSSVLTREGFGANADSSHGYSLSFVDQSLPSARKSLLNQDGKFSLLARPWSLMPSSLLLKLAESNMRFQDKVDLSFKSALGRSVDLSKLNNYDELIAELFEFGGNFVAEFTSTLGKMNPPRVLKLKVCGESFDSGCKRSETSVTPFENC
ncbi:hypothetical protein Ddye_004194 [Dipteronia dyeriana]|uniref:Uncharacterized protein n=1 Tax=Dipteronia dyeriana TaxID=168575 RepID=A0AAE0CW28_9ROSI|nr:hypothetical protein Ddye_004194 [Dipteronia dyeriana]